MPSSERRSLGAGGLPRRPPGCAAATRRRRRPRRPRWRRWWPGAPAVPEQPAPGRVRRSARAKCVAGSGRNSSARLPPRRRWHRRPGACWATTDLTGKHSGKRWGKRRHDGRCCSVQPAPYARGARLVVGHLFVLGRQRPPCHPVGLHLERDPEVGALMTLPGGPPERVRAEVPTQEPEDPVATPLAEVHELVAQEVLAVGSRCPHRDHPPDRDGVGAGRNGSADQDHVGPPPHDVHATTLDPGGPQQPGPARTCEMAEPDGPKPKGVSMQVVPDLIRNPAWRFPASAVREGDRTLTFAELTAGPTIGGGLCSAAASRPVTASRCSPSTRWSTSRSRSPASARASSWPRSTTGSPSRSSRTSSATAAPGC